MPVIQISIEDIKSRGNFIRRLLKPLASERLMGGPAWEPKVTSAEFIIGTHEGSPPISNYQDWRFSTRVPDLRAMYYERWVRIEDDTTSLYYLERAYLHIYQIVDRRTGQEAEFLCLHWGWFNYGLE